MLDDEMADHGPKAVCGKDIKGQVLLNGAYAAAPSVISLSKTMREQLGHLYDPWLMIGRFTPLSAK